MLLTSLYMHFIIEHNRGHHRRVARGRIRHRARFWREHLCVLARTILFSFISAWKIEADRGGSSNTALRLSQRDDPLTMIEAGVPLRHLLVHRPLARLLPGAALIDPVLEKRAITSNTMA